MTIVEKAAYLKGLVEGLGAESDSREGKLWTAVTELFSEMAHEIEDLQESNADFAEAMDDISKDLSYLEELTCDLDTPEDMMDEEDYEDYYGCGGEDDEDESHCAGLCSSCSSCHDEDDEEGSGDSEDEESEYDGDVYDVKCPVCGEEITVGEDVVAEGSTKCPVCGELLEFDLSEEEED